MSKARPFGEHQVVSVWAEASLGVFQHRRGGDPLRTERRRSAQGCTDGQVALEHDLVLRGVLRHRQQLPVELVLYIIHKLDAGVEVPLRARDPVQVLRRQ